jgi:hypothetical protein
MNCSAKLIFFSFFFSFVFCISLSTEWSHHEAQTTGKARCVGLNHAI